MGVRGVVIMVKSWGWMRRAGLVLLVAGLLVVGALALSRGDNVDAKGPPGAQAVKRAQFDFGALD